MLKTLENDSLRLTVDTHGAEIHSLVAKDTGIEYIWQADPNYWQRHAPILFPIVGKLKMVNMNMMELFIVCQVMVLLVIKNLSLADRQKILWNTH